MASKRRAAPRAVYQVNLDEETYEYVTGMMKTRHKEAEAKQWAKTLPKSWAIVDRAWNQINSAADEMVDRFIDNEPKPKRRVLQRK